MNVTVIKKNFQVSNIAKNIVTTCADATATATNSDGDVLGTVSIASGGTGNIPIGNSNINKSDGTLITELPAEDNYNVADSVITLNDTLNNPISTTNVKATEVANITAPNGTVTAKNSLNQTIGTQSVTSNGSADINIGNSAITRQNGTLLSNVPATNGYVVPNGTVNLVDSLNNPISTTSTQASSTDQITAPNGTANLTDQFGNSLPSVSVRSNATQSDVITVPCSHLKSRLNQYGTGAFASLGGFATLVGNARAVAVNSGFIYLTNQNNVEKFNATTFVSSAVIMGFSQASEIAFSPDGLNYAVVNTNANTVRIMDTATDTQVASFPCVTSPFSISYSPDGTELYVAPFAAASTITRYSLTGTLLGTFTGFDANIVEIRSFGLNYYVLTATGTTSASTQRVMVMNGSTQITSFSLGTVTNFGEVRSMVIQGTSIYIASVKSNIIFMNEFDLNFTLLRQQNLGLNGVVSFGLAYNPFACGSLILPQPTAGRAISILI